MTEIVVGRQIAARRNGYCFYCSHVIGIGQRISQVTEGTLKGWAHDSCVAGRQAQLRLAAREQASWGAPYTPTESERKEHDAAVALAFLRSRGSTLGRP